MNRLSIGAALLLLTVACSDDGSASADGSATAGGSSTGDPATTGDATLSASSTNGATTGSGEDTTTGATTTGDVTAGGSGDGGYEDDDGGTGCGFTCPAPPTNPPGGGLGCLCPEGEKCMAWANDGGWIPNAIRCSPIDPTPGAPGDPCAVEGSAVSGIDTCEAGAACWDVDSTDNTGVCHSLCGADPDEPICPDGQLCNSIGALTLCVEACDPLVPDACAEGQACQPANAGFGCLASPFENVNPIGGGCIADYSCEPGAACVDQALVQDCGFEFCCAEMCPLDPPPYSCAQNGTSCVAFPDAPPIEAFAEVGVCLL